MKKWQNFDIDVYKMIFPIDQLFSFPIRDYLQLHLFERGEWIVQEGTSPQFLYFVVEGKAKIYTTQKNGRTILLNFIIPGTFIGEMELFHDTHYSKGIQTTAKTTCIAIPVNAVYDQLMHDAMFLRQLCVFLSNKATLMTAKYSQGLNEPIENRLAEFILLSAENCFYAEKNTEVADYLGVSYRHLLHCFTVLVKRGYIEKIGRSQYKIVNKSALQKIASDTIPLNVIPL